MQDSTRLSGRARPSNNESVAVNTFGRNIAFISGKAVRKFLTQLRRGIEKEGLRVDPNGNLSTTPHPKKLGSALTNPWLTTDFSESLLEFITPVLTSVDDTLEYLKNIHIVAHKNLNGENIWASSMPCVLPKDDQIPIAQYGNSNISKMKTVYRIGLGHRYGRAMQTIAGIHYNFSLPEKFWTIAFANAVANNETAHTDLQKFINQRYLDLIRNFRRNYWILIYLFGAAPCFDKSFVRGRPHKMESLGKNDLYLPFATSLRMGDLGYQSAAQQSLFVCYNQLDTYIETLGEAIHTPYRDYESIGVVKDGEYRQLSTALLQIENEFYSPIRPKRVTNSGEAPLRALSERGIEYIEVRCLDINPFTVLGIDAETIRFLDTFLLYCLVKESPQCDKEEFQLIAVNQSRIVNKGRDPHLLIYCNKNQVPMRECAIGILNDIKKVAEQLDLAHRTSVYSDSVKLQCRKLHDESLTPSARLLRRMADNNESHIAFTLKQTQLFAKEFANQVMAVNIERKLLASAEESLARQRALEQNTATSFEQFLAAYYQQ